MGEDAIALTPWQPVTSEGWERIQAKRAFEIVLGKMLQPEAKNPDDEIVPYLRALNVQWSALNLGENFKDVGTMWATPQDIEALRLLPGDLLVCEGGEVGRAARINVTLPDNTIIQNALHRVRGSELGDVGFLSYCLKHAADSGWFEVICNRATIAHFTVEKFRDLWLHLPPLPTQRRIADFLDRETAQIDALIEAKEQMLALLQEKRAAQISQMVTKGLNPDAQMKDSGLAWLGEIPAHWEVRRIKHVAEVRGGITLGKDYGGKNLEEFSYLRVANVQDGSINLENVAKIMVPPGEAQNYFLQPGDVLMNEGGDADKLGRGAVWDGSIEPCLHQNHVFAVRTYAIDPQWLNAWTSTIPAKIYFESRAKRSTNLASISSTNIREMPLICPPENEQDEILRWISEFQEHNGLLTKQIQETLNLLRERRGALITAAVTGQLPEVLA